MMQRLRIKHLTEYHFPEQVTLHQHKLLLRPREGHDVRIESSKLNITPAYSIKWQRDVFDNSLAVANFTEQSDKLIIDSEVVIQHYEHAPFDFMIEDYAQRYPFKYALDDQLDLASFQQPIFVNDQQDIRNWLQQFGLIDVETFPLLLSITQAIKTQLRYQTRDEAGVQSPGLTLSQRWGTCRDYATLFIGACRNLGLASRFVSGYLHAPSTEAGHATTHAWAEVYLPGTGWKGFDPTAGEVTGSHHIAVAVTRNPEAVPPVAGSFTASGDRNITTTMNVNVQVNQLD